MKLLTKALTGLATIALVAGGGLNTTAAHASIIKDGWRPLTFGSDVRNAGVVLSDLSAVEAAGCAAGSSWTLVLRPFNDPDGDGYNNDAEPKGAPNGLIPMVPGNPVAPSWRKGTELVDQNSSYTITPQLMVNPPTFAPGVHRYAMGALCVTDTGDPNYFTQAARLDSNGNPLGQWFTLDIEAVDVNGPATFTMVDRDAFQQTVAPTAPRLVTVTVTNTAEVIEHTVDRRVTMSGRPTSTVIFDGMVTYTVTRPAVTVTVPGPTPAVTVTVNPDPFKVKCHTDGAAKPWWCTLEDFYWALVKGWIN